MKKYYSIFLLTLLFLGSRAYSQNSTCDVLSGLKFRSIGPAFMSGRISDFAVDPENSNRYFVAVASGGIWLTENNGITYTPVFDNQGSYSIGCITIDPNNNHVVWAGTGENNSQRSVSYGDGVYKSLDGGKSWKNMGLKTSKHIAKIIVHPKNSDIVYVASQGPLWGPGGERGLYQTTDGGETWEPCLTISENTGVTDLVMHPENPDILYAASYQRRRHVFTLVNGGPESAIYKSTDAGKNWKKIHKGLPSVDLGRIGIAISPVNPDVLYAIVEAADGKDGLFRTANGGASWQKVNDYKNTSPQYYSEIVADPKDENKLFLLDTYTKVSEDGGKTLQTVGLKNRHVDDHALWIDPENTDHLIIGGDGGVYETYDGGEIWAHKQNLPITQFYRVSVDNSYPFYNVYGGTQDNSTIGGPSSTINNSGIINADWFLTKGGDGFETVVDPKDPNIIYSQSQYGWLVRYDKQSGEAIDIKPRESIGDEPFRWNWDAPIIISPHNHKRIYFAANKLFRSDDRGNSWQVISPDLTKKIDRNKLKVMGRIQSVDVPSKNASTSFFGNIVSLSESPLVEGLIYVGTDDGLIQVSEDGGENWRKVDKIANVPEMAYVSCLTASLFDENTVYATFDNHKNNDFKTYVYKSENRGRSWNPIIGDLPEEQPAYSIIQDHIDENLLFLGTEYGVFFTNDHGKSWCQLKSGLPTISVRDIDIQRRENDLVLATFGRGFYILDDYAPLRNIDDETLEKEYHLFDIPTALLYIKRRPFGYGKGSQGSSFYTADNPEFGAVFTYYIKNGFESLKSKRQKKEADLLKAGEEIVYPGYSDLRKEDLEKNPYLLFNIYNKDEEIIRRLKAQVSKGIHRIAWDLRYFDSDPVWKNSKNENESGLPVIPGDYWVELVYIEDSTTTVVVEKSKFTVKQLDNLTLPTADPLALNSFRKQVVALKKSIDGLVRIVNEMEENVQIYEQAVKVTPTVSLDLLTDIRALELSLHKCAEKLYRGDQVLSKRNHPVGSSLRGQLGSIIWGMSNSTSEPTQTHKDVYQNVKTEYKKLFDRVLYLQDHYVNKIEGELDKHGAPYTPGRIPKIKAENNNN